MNKKNEEQTIEQIYLLSLEELEIEGMKEQCLRYLDPERRKRAENSRTSQKCAETIGAGLLLQLAVQNWKAGIPMEKVSRYSVSRVLELLAGMGEPILLKYRYTEQGKPYFKELPLFFSVSHSGGYVLCVVSEEEIGADIQEKKEPVQLRIPQRYFAPGEQRYFTQLCEKGTSNEISDWFYRLWCRKESWGKLTGQGLPAVLGLDCEAQSDVFWEEQTTEDGYRIAICRRCDEESGNT